MLETLAAVARALELAVGWVFSPSWLPPKDFEFFKWLVVPGYGYGFVLIGFAILELIIPQQRRPWSRASLLSGTYLLFAGKLGIYTFVVAPLIRNAWVALDLPSLHLDRVLPLPVYMVVGVLTVTLTAYWAHRCMHRITPLWHIHKIHHSARNLNCASIYQMHFLELLLQTPSHLIVVLALGTDLVAPFGIIFKVIDVLGHANVRLNLGWLTYFISTPQAHRIHHSLDPRHHDTNFGNTIMLWDHVFGTFHYDRNNLPTAYGVHEDIPQSFVLQQVLPLVTIAKLAAAGVAGLYGRARGPTEPPEGGGRVAVESAPVRAP